MVHSCSSSEGSARSGHAGSRLGAEVLDDDFLDVTEFPVERPQRQQGLDSLGPRFADADQDSRSERYAQLAGGANGGEARGRQLVGRTVVRAATT